MSSPRTLLSKIYDRHRIADLGDGDMLMYVDFHLVHEVTSPQAFEGLRQRGIDVHAPAQTLTVADHNVPTLNRGRASSTRKAGRRSSSLRSTPPSSAYRGSRWTASIRASSTLWARSRG